MLEGSVRKGGNRLRISAQLIETETGNHLWAEKYDGTLEDVFDLQDRITEGVAGAIEPSLRQAEVERARRKRPENLDAYDLYLRALPHAWVYTPAEAEKAIECLDAALRIDPGYVAAHGLAAWCNGHYAWFDPDDPGRSVAVQHANPLGEQIRHFGAVIRGEETPRITGEDGARTLAVTLAVRDAADSGKTVEP